MNSGDWFETPLFFRGLVQPGIPFGGVAPEQPGQVRDPRSVDLDAIESLGESLGRRARHFAPRIGAQEGVDVDARSHQSLGNAPAGKICAAFFQRMRANSSFVSNASRYGSFAKPVSIVRSVPHSNRFAPTLSRQASSIPPSPPLPHQSTQTL